MGGLACAALVHLVRVMRSNCRRLDFLGLTGTMLGDGEARLLADALNDLPARDPAAEAEIIELKQVHVSEPVRDQLSTAGTRAGVDVRLSRVAWHPLNIDSLTGLRIRVGLAAAASLNKYTARPAP